MRHTRTIITQQSFIMASHAWHRRCTFTFEIYDFIFCHVITLLHIQCVASHLLKNALMRCKQLKMARVNERQARLTWDLKKREKWRDYRWFLFISTLVFIIAKMKQIIPIHNTFHLYPHKYIYEIKTFIMFIVKLLTVMYDYKSLLLKKNGKINKTNKKLKSKR